MKDSWTSGEILAQYAESGAIMEKATLEGDYRTNNSEGGVVLKVFKFLERNKELASITLPSLLQDGSTVTRTIAAAHCLALNIHIEEATEALERVAQDESTGILGFSAGMTLKVWRKQGYLRMYPEGE